MLPPQDKRETPSPYVSTSCGGAQEEVLDSSMAEKSAELSNSRGESISIQAAIRRGIRGFLVAREEGRFCRLPYNDIVPTSNLLASGPIETMTLLLGGVDQELTNDWARGRIVDFLWKGNIYETLNHISPYIEALSCYGDNWCNAFFERTLDALKLQRRIIEQVSSTVAVTVEYRQFVK